MYSYPNYEIGKDKTNTVLFGLFSKREVAKRHHEIRFISSAIIAQHLTKDKLRWKQTAGNSVHNQLLLSYNYDEDSTPKRCP